MPYPGFVQLFIKSHLVSSALFQLCVFQGLRDRIEIGTDASPWGLGGWVSVNGTITKHFHSEVSEHVIRFFGLARGSCEGQQILECPAILVAVRAWLPSCENRIQLNVRGDNVGALTLVLTMRPETAALVIIARELALCLVQFSFPIPAYR